MLVVAGLIDQLRWRGGRDNRGRRAKPPPFHIDWSVLAPAEFVAPPDLGLVSCLCVTRGRTHHVERALRCFLAQTYANKELIVVHESLDDEARRLLEGAAGQGVSLVHVPPEPKRPLGELRNISVSAARGKYICGWDDDDWYSPRRIEAQLRHLLASQADACVLNRWLVLDETRGNAYVSERGGWQGSLTCPRELPALQHGYPPLARDEDRILVDQIAKRHRLVVLDRPELYVYTFHGDNTWPPGHFQWIFSSGQALSPTDAAGLSRLVGGGWRPPSQSKRAPWRRRVPRLRAR
jgi:glycosyltransferase involved in cell wall biosynthesis